MTFQNANKNVQMLTMNIYNINIEQVKQFDLLCLIIDINLNLKRHIEKRQMHILKRLVLKSKTCYLNKLKRYYIIH